MNILFKAFDGFQRTIDVFELTPIFKIYSYNFYDIPLFEFPPRDLTMKSTHLRIMSFELIRRESDGSLFYAEIELKEINK